MVIIIYRKEKKINNLYFLYINVNIKKNFFFYLCFILFILYVIYKDVFHLPLIKRIIKKKNYYNYYFINK